MRISDWSSDVCSSDLQQHRAFHADARIKPAADEDAHQIGPEAHPDIIGCDLVIGEAKVVEQQPEGEIGERIADLVDEDEDQHDNRALTFEELNERRPDRAQHRRSEEHTSELQSLMRNSYAVFCLKKKKKLYHTKNYRRTNIQ